MKLSTQLRAHLRANPDGFAQSELCAYFGSSSQTMREALTLMGDAYIDRWAPRQIVGKTVWEPVWCVVDVPESCPKPDYPPASDKVSLIAIVRELQPVTIAEISEVAGISVSSVAKMLSKRKDVFVSTQVCERGGTKKWSLK